MNKQLNAGIKRAAGLVTGIFLVGSPAMAATIDWTAWSSGDPNAGTATGTITTSSSTVTVNYVNPRGYGFIETGSGIDYFRNGTDTTANSPYTSSLVGNIPTASQMVALDHAGPQTLTFSQSIANPVFSYVSLNGNGYGFINQDFDILSWGGPGSPDGPKNAGYWGSGTSYKQVVDLGGGNFEYELLGTGEPHGTIRFKGAFDSVTWLSLSDEYWNGFTVGVEGTAAEVFNTPDSGSTLSLMGLSFTALALLRRRAAKV